MAPIKSRREFLREGYLYVCGVLLAVALIAPISDNIGDYWKSTLNWAFGISVWLGLLYLLLFFAFLPGLALMAKNTIMTGVEPREARLKAYIQRNGAKRASGAPKQAGER